MNRYLSTIFCDDVRWEIGGKLSYIGVYSGVLLAPEFPVTLPRLCLAMSAGTPASRPFQKLSFKVLQGEKRLAEGLLEAEQIAYLANAADAIPKEDARNIPLVSHSILTFSPFHLDSPCLLTVCVETEEGELCGAGLRIEQAPADSPLPHPLGHQD
jgi:hypothetical protein